MFPLLIGLLASTPITVHSDLPRELNVLLEAAIEKQTGKPPAMSAHSHSEGALGAAEHARIVRLTSRGSVMLATYEPKTGRLDAYLIDRTGNIERAFSMEIARGLPQARLSIDALVRAAFPRLENPLAAMTDEDPPIVQRASHAITREPEPQSGAFEVTVEINGRPTR